MNTQNRPLVPTPVSHFSFSNLTRASSFVIRTFSFSPNRKSKIENRKCAIRICLLTIALSLQSASAATVTGTLTDISLAPLTTKMLFTPTTNVLVVGSGLSAGPPKMITTASGAFSLDLEAGDYTVSLPLITYRAPFRISVPDSVSTFNITNLLSPPITYTYTNWLATGPLHVNTSRVTVWSTNNLQTLLDSGCTLPAGTLAAGKVITIDAFGSSSDPASNGPDLTFTLKLGSTTIWTQTKTPTGNNWHLRALITIRSSGVSGTVAASSAIVQENGSPDLFPFTSA